MRRFEDGVTLIFDKNGTCKAMSGGHKEMAAGTYSIAKGADVNPIAVKMARLLCL